jgi:gluconolactonase
MKMKRVWMIGLMVIFLTSLVFGDGIVAQDAIVKKLAGDFKFTEGPAADKEGNVFFTDIPNSRIHKWSVEGTLSTFLENSRQANGLYFDKDGNLIACAGGTGQMISIDPAGTITVLADSFEGKPFNSPNDLWIDPAGGIYFTDPRYGSRDNLPQGGEYVYYLSPDRKRVIRVIDEMVRPNGLIGTPDGKLYVADHGAEQTFLYTINPDGTLTEKRLFVPQGADGMTMDERGNVYLTGEAVTVYDANGQLIQTIAVPERPSNVTFGGKDNKTLFITARSSLYSIEMQVAGQPKADEKKN